MDNPRHQPGDEDRAAAGRKAALSVAVVAAAFLLVVAGTMLAFALAGREVPPSTDRLSRLKAGLETNPADVDLKQRIRREDEGARRAFFREQAFLRRGAWLLLIAACAALLAIHRYQALVVAPAKPRPPVADDEQRMSFAWRAGVAAAGVGVALVCAWVLMAFHGPMASDAGVTAHAKAVGRPVDGAAPAPDASGFRDNWPRFRGPDGQGVAGPGPWPVEWHGPTGKSILWTCPLPDEGKGSPVVWVGRIFVTAATRNVQRVLCIERVSGKMLWNVPLRRPPPTRTAREGQEPADSEPLNVPDDTGWAAASPVTDGTHVFVTFATADVACLDFQGRQVWARNFGRPDSAYGLASSLEVFGGLLIYQLDQGGSAEDKLSALYGLDKKTGKTVWRCERAVPNSWSTPCVARTPGGPQIVTAADPWVAAYDPEFGVELWRVKGLSGDVASSPIYAGGLVMAASAHSKLLAIRPDGKGDVTDTHVAWDAADGLPDVCSPVSNGDILLLVTGSGELTAIETATGKTLWEHRLPDNIAASPTLAGGRVYLPDTKGKTHVFGLGREFKALSVPDLGEPIFASPAFGDGRIYIRTTKRLYCVGALSEATTPAAGAGKEQP
jgi:outer membrane protein assembly factor BamB